MEKQKIPFLQKKVIQWYRKNQRPMPWRNTTDPYKIWVSEIMLQQTQVETVIPYYMRFINEFPTVNDLANAKLSHVMKAWEGLGYYSRARSLYFAAQYILSQFKGIIPSTKEDLLSLPGVGLYTAGAILSIGFQIPAPILDGNVIRLLSRIFHITENVSLLRTKKILWQLSERIIPKKQVREFNQGLMDLGAVVCRPKRPNCQACPISTVCQAFRLNIQKDLPVKSPKKPVPHYDVTAGIIWKNDRILITLRPPKGLLGGLWEFPGGKKEEDESLQNCLKREIDEELDIDIDVGDLFIVVNHAYTHMKITLHVFYCMWKKGEPKTLACHAFRWVKIRELNQFAFPAADRKVIEKLMKTSGGLHNED